MGQSSNDVIPTAIHVSAAIAIKNQLLPSLAHLHETLLHKVQQCPEVKTGRTHLMDVAKLSQEIEAWAKTNI